MQKERYTLVADFAVQGDLAYLSHQETLTLFQRAFARAALPMVYSSGFNPHPQVSIPFPRSVGTCSSGDRLTATVEFESPPSCNDLFERIQRHLPSGCYLQDLRCVAGKCTFVPREVRYRLYFKFALGQMQQSHLQSCRHQLCEGEMINVQRYWAKKKRYKQFDISPYVQSLIIKGDCIEVVCCVSPAGTVRVDELIQWLNIGIADLRQPTERTDICWNQN